MANTKRKALSFLAVSTLLGATGQLLFKFSFQFGFSSTFAFYMGLGLFAYVASTVFYFYVLSRMHLSWTYSISGISYVIAVVLAAALLQEYIPPIRWVGVLIVTAGIFLIGVS